MEKKDYFVNSCKKSVLPEEIRNIIGNEPYTRNTTGMSDSDVLIFSKHVLKIQPHSVETDNENAVVNWLNGRVTTPAVLAYVIEEGKAYTLMTKVEGKMLCEEEYLNTPERLIKLAAEGLRKLWAVNVENCPLKVSRLDERLKAARYNVENNLVDLDNVEPETFGPGGFSDPEELLCWLEQNKPEEDIVLTHGDFCLPNIFVDNNSTISFIDLGKMGPADRWQDVAIAIRSLEHNFSGKYNGGVSFFHFEPQMLLDELEIVMDDEKNKYYRLLDELF